MVLNYVATEELHDLIWLSREYLNEIDCGKRVLPYTIVAAYLSMAFGCLAELESCYCNQTENNRLHHASSKKMGVARASKCSVITSSHTQNAESLQDPPPFSKWRSFFFIAGLLRLIRPRR